MDKVHQNLLQVIKRDTFFLTSDNIDKMWLTMKTDYSVKAKRRQSTKKVLSAMFFFRSEGPVVQVSIPKGRSLTGHIYKKYVLNKVKKHNERNLQHST